MYSQIDAVSVGDRPIPVGTKWSLSAETPSRLSRPLKISHGLGLSATLVQTRGRRPPRNVRMFLHKTIRPSGSDPVSLSSTNVDGSDT